MQHSNRNNRKFRGVNKKLSEERIKQDCESKTLFEEERNKKPQKIFTTINYKVNQTISCR